jgi:hypothetical protein
MSFSDYLENKTLDVHFGAASYTPPATLYIELLTDSNTGAQRDAGTVTAVSTGSWTNYARLAVTNNSTNFPNASGGAKSNGTDITFTAATIPSGTVTVTAIAIYDASTSGNIMGAASLTTPKVMSDGDIFVIAAGDLDITLT